MTNLFESHNAAMTNHPLNRQQSAVSQNFCHSVQPRNHCGASISNVRRPESHGSWIGVQGRRIMQGSSVQVGGKDMVIGNEQSRALDKGKAPAFPPWRVCYLRYNLTLFTVKCKQEVNTNYCYFFMQL